MNKKIEKGCMAIIIGGFVKSNTGKIVKVGNFIGEKPFFGDSDLWEIDRLIDFNNPMNIKTQHAMCSEKTMQRIGDEDITQQKETTKSITA